MEKQAAQRRTPDAEAALVWTNQWPPQHAWGPTCLQPWLIRTLTSSWREKEGMSVKYPSQTGLKRQNKRRKELTKS
jgi:hypothetical protein